MSNREKLIMQFQGISTNCWILYYKYAHILYIDIEHDKKKIIVKFVALTNTLTNIGQKYHIYG